MKHVLCNFILSLIIISFLPAYELIDTPYQEEEIVFPSSDSSIMLGGTVTIPDNIQIIGKAVILSVAGPTDRDGTFGPHQFYKGLAHELASYGIATLRFDDRGVGKSKGNLLNTGLEDRAGDACQALKTLNEHDSWGSDVKTGFIGVSEGGGIGTLAAAECGPADFTVLLSTPTRTGQEVLKGQLDRMIKMSLLTDEKKINIKKELNQFLQLASASDASANRNKLLAILSGPYGRSILPPYQFVPKTPEAQTDFVLSPWYQSQLHYNIKDELSNATHSVMALYGSLDKVINPDLNANVLKKLNPDASVTVIPGLNHLMQKAKTGLPTEYGILPGAVSASVADSINTFILNL